MDYSKLAELQYTLNECKKQIEKERDSKKILDEIAESLVDISTQITDLARQIRPLGNDPYVAYQDKLKSILDTQMLRFGLSKHALAQEMGVHHATLADFWNKGRKRQNIPIIENIEEYISKHGYNVEQIRLEAGL